MQWKVFKASIPVDKVDEILSHLHDLCYGNYTDEDNWFYKWIWNGTTPLYIYTDETATNIVNLHFSDSHETKWLYKLIPYEEYDYKAILEWRRSDDMRKLLCCH